MIARKATLSGSARLRMLFILHEVTGPEPGVKIGVIFQKMLFGGGHRCFSLLTYYARRLCGQG